MAFVSASPFTRSALFTLRRSPSTCRPRMTSESDETPSGKKLPVTNSPPSNRKLVRNVSDQQNAVNQQPNAYADARPGDMVGGPPVGEGMGPRRGVKEKKVTRAAAIQKSKGFADAWAEQNQGRVDVWLIIGLITLLTPLIILAWAVATGVIPTGGLFEEY